MKTFLKAQAASFIATIADYVVTALLIEWFFLPVVPSAGIGNVAGAIVNFLIGRSWVFDPKSGSVGVQAMKYGLVWCGYLVLSIAGMTLLENLTSLHYLISKAIVSVVLAVTYNYFLQKKFVFN